MERPDEEQKTKDTLLYKYRIDTNGKTKDNVVSILPERRA